MISESNLNRYRMFCAAAECESISRAAEMNYISQPAVSRSIISLEENLGVRLFLRGHNGVTLTEEGELLFGHLKKAFSEINTAEERIRELSGSGAGHLRIGTSAVLCKNVLLPYLKKFIELYPKIRINIECRSSRLAADMLESGEIDAALIVRPKNTGGLAFYSLGKIKDIFAASPSFLETVGYEKGKTLDMSGFAEIMEKAGGIMLLDRSNGTRRHIDRFFREKDIAAERFGVIEVSGMDMLIEFALTGLGIACVIESFVEEDIRCGRLSVINLSEKIPEREIGIAFCADRELSGGAKYFIDFIQNIL